MVIEAVRNASAKRSVPKADWSRALTALALAWAACGLITLREWREMADQWWNSATYSHILLIPAIVAWLAWEKRGELARLAPAGSWAGAAAFAMACLLWLGGRATGLNLLAHAGAVGMLQSAVVALLGVRAGALLALPLGMMVFLVPFGQEIVPALQAITAELAIALTHLSGIPAQTDGIFIDTPAGLFIVAEACSGVRFLVAAFALGVLVCFTAFDSWARRTAFMAAAVIVPILANGVRAWGTIYIAQSQGARFAEGFDHIVYGWIFFAIVLALLIGGARPFFQRTPDEAGWTAIELDRLPSLVALTAFDGRRPAALAALAMMAGVAAIAAHALGG